MRLTTDKGQELLTQAQECAALLQALVTDVKDHYRDEKYKLVDEKASRAAANESALHFSKSVNRMKKKVLAEAKKEPKVERMKKIDVAFRSRIEAFSPRFDELKTAKTESIPAASELRNNLIELSAKQKEILESQDSPKADFAECSKAVQELKKIVKDHQETDAKIRSTITSGEKVLEKLNELDSVFNELRDMSEGIMQRVIEIKFRTDKQKSTREMEKAIEETRADIKKFEKTASEAVFELRRLKTRLNELDIRVTMITEKIEKKIAKARRRIAAVWFG